MGYFAETMALFEFKSDIELDIAQKRENDHYSRSHLGDSKRANDQLDKFNKSRSGTVRNMEDYNNRNNENRIATGYSKTADELLSGSRNGKPNRHQRKACKESFSEAFDSIVL